MLTKRFRMNTEEILRAIDVQIAQLRQARELIAGSVTAEPAAQRRGRPKGSTNKTPPAPAKVTKRTMSAEAKARIAAAQKLRWAKQKSTDKPVKPAAKKSTPAVAEKAATKPSAAKKTAAAEA